MEYYGNTLKGCSNSGDLQNKKNEKITKIAKFLKTSWCSYRNTCNYVLHPLNGITVNTTIDVYTTHELLYNDTLYINNGEYETPHKISHFENDQRKHKTKINNKMYNVNTSSYDKLFINASDNVKNLYDEIETYVLLKNNKIFRNYLCKNVVFKYKSRILQIFITNQKLSILFSKHSKEYDNNNMMYLKKGYEKQSLCYCLDVFDDATLKYALNIFDKEFDYIYNDTGKVFIAALHNELCNQISKIDSQVSSSDTIKGIVFKGNKNFCKLEKRKYGIHVSLLSVDDSENILSDVIRTNNESLSRYYNVECMEDIEIIIPYLKKSFELSKINYIYN